MNQWSRPTALSLIGGVCGALLLAGCSGSADRAMDGTRAADYLLPNEPPGAIGVLECRETLEQKEKPIDVALIGRIGGVGQATWEPERAVFMMADLSLAEADEHEEVAAGHDADNCPFCRAKKKQELAGLAMIEVVDASGQVPGVSAQDMLGLEEGQEIVVRGTAELDALGTLLVHTAGIYVRPARDKTPAGGR